MIALYGGSFDPPHFGHRALVQAALAALPLDEVWVTPVGIPPHRVLTSHVPAACRLRWLRILFQDVERAHVWDWELRQDRVIATIETLQSMPKQGCHGVPLLLLGMDAWSAMETWVGYPAHRQWCNVAVFSRVGVVAARLSGWQALSLAQWLDHPPQQPGNVVYIDADLPSISASSVRKKLASAGDESYLQDVPDHYGWQLAAYYAARNRENT